MTMLMLMTIMMAILKTMVITCVETQKVNSDYDNYDNVDVDDNYDGSIKDNNAW